MKIEEEDVEILPVPVDGNDFRVYTVRELLGVIQKKLDDGDIEMDTRVFSHIYTDDGFAFEYPEVCIDTVDGLDIDLDGRGLKESVLSEHGMNWYTIKERMPYDREQCLIVVDNQDIDSVATYYEKSNFFSYMTFDSLEGEYVEEFVHPERVDMWMPKPRYNNE